MMEILIHECHMLWHCEYTVALLSPLVCACICVVSCRAIAAWCSLNDLSLSVLDCCFLFSEDGLPFLHRSEHEISHQRHFLSVYGDSLKTYSEFMAGPTMTLCIRIFAVRGCGRVVVGSFLVIPWDSELFCVNVATLLENVLIDNVHGIWYTTTYYAIELR